VPEALEPWFDPTELEDASRAFPQLRERIALTMPGDGAPEAEEEPRTIFQELGDSPEIRSLGEQYVQEAWLPWALEITSRRCKPWKTQFTEHYNAWDPEQNQRRIGQLEQQLDEARRAEASTLYQLRAIREAETYRHPRRFGNYEGTAQAIASRLREEEPHYAWVAVQPSEDQEPPLTDAEAMGLISLLRLLDNYSEEELNKILVDLHDLTAPDAFAMGVRSEVEAKARFDAAAEPRRHLAYVTLASAPREHRQAFLSGLFEFLSAYELVLHHGQRWLQEAATQILSERHYMWHEPCSITGEQLEAVGDRARQATERRISGLGERNRDTVKGHAAALLAHLEAGGGFGVWWFRSQVVTDARYLIDEVRVDGRLCREAEPLRELLEWLWIAERLDTLHRHWSGHIDPPAGPFTVQVASYQDYYVLLKRALALRTS
jgi:hypothetical protein